MNIWEENVALNQIDGGVVFPPTRVFPRHTSHSVTIAAMDQGWLLMRTRARDGNEKRLHDYSRGYIYV